MPKRISTTIVDDFTGGLNLNANAFQLVDNESPDLLNVDLGPQGGVSLRKGMVSTIHTTSKVPLSSWTFRPNSSSAEYALTQESTTHGIVAYNSGVSTFYTTAPLGTSTGTSKRWHAANFSNPLSLANNACYIVRAGTLPSLKWTGVAASATVAELVNPTVGPTWSEDFESPIRNNMPIAYYATAHREYMFVASTLETGGITHDSRVRFSHPGEVESWRALDWFDVEPGRYGKITGMVSSGDTLYIFKDSAIYALRGYDADSFDLTKISDQVGAVSQEAIVVTPVGAYCFSWPEGVYRVGSDGVQEVSSKIQPLFEDNGVTIGARLYSIFLGWVGRRLYVSLPLVASDATTVCSHSYVYDPEINAWTVFRYASTVSGVRYYRGFQGFFSLSGANTASTSGAIVDYAWEPINTTSLVTLESTTTGADTSAYSGTEKIEAFYQTAWMDMENPALVKSWKRPTIVVDSEGTDYVLQLYGYKDYSVQGIPVDFVIGNPASIPTTNSVWGTGVWNTAKWAVATGDRLDIEKGARLGRATSVSLKIVGPVGSTIRWAVSAIVWKFIPKRMKS